jgi:flagellar hook-length control protein FliK
MDNSMIVQIVSLQTGCCPGGNTKGVHAEQGAADFLSTIKESMKSLSNDSLQQSGKTGPDQAAQTGTYHSYLESLRKELLAKGGSLEKISLSKEDLPLLRRLFFQCGFSQKEVEGLLAELTEHNPHGKITLSEVFSKLVELDSAKRKTKTPLTLDQSALPYIESVLRECGVTPKAAERILEGASIEGGGLDLHKLVMELKAINDKEMNLVDRAKLDQFVKKIERVMGGAQAPEGVGQGNEDKPTGSLQKIAAGLGKEHEVPREVKATIDEIVKRAAVTEEGDKRVSSLRTVSKPEIKEPHAKKGGEKSSNKEKSETSLSPLKENRDINTKEEVRPGVERGEGLRGGAREENYSVKAEAKLSDVPQDTTNAHPTDTVKSETITEAKAHSNPVRPSLPAHLINQVRRQISRALVRGERVIRLQLRPPDLGSLRIEMDMKDNVLKLGMITENSSVKETLLSNIHELRESLVEQGVRLERLDIQIGYNFDQSLAQSKEGLKEGNGEGAGGGQVLADEAHEDTSPGMWVRATGDHLLDLMA